MLAPSKRTRLVSKVFKHYPKSLKFSNTTVISLEKEGKKEGKKKKSLARVEIHVADLFLEEITENVIKSPKVWELWMAMLLSQRRDFWMQLEIIAIAACEPRNEVCLGAAGEFISCCRDGKAAGFPAISHLSIAEL